MPGRGQSRASALPSSSDAPPVSPVRPPVNALFAVKDVMFLVQFQQQQGHPFQPKTSSSDVLPVSSPVRPPVNALSASVPIQADVPQTNVVFLYIFQQPQHAHFILTPNKLISCAASVASAPPSECPVCSQGCYVPCTIPATTGTSF